MSRSERYDPSPSGELRGDGMWVQPIVRPPSPRSSRVDTAMGMGMGASRFHFASSKLALRKYHRLSFICCMGIERVRYFSLLDVVYLRW